MHRAAGKRVGRRSRLFVVGGVMYAMLLQRCENGCGHGRTRCFVTVMNACGLGSCIIPVIHPSALTRPQIVRTKLITQPVGCTYHRLRCWRLAAHTRTEADAHSSSRLVGVRDVPAACRAPQSAALTTSNATSSALQRFVGASRKTGVDALAGKALVARPRRSESTFDAVASHVRASSQHRCHVPRRWVVSRSSRNFRA